MDSSPSFLNKPNSTWSPISASIPANQTVYSEAHQEPGLLMLIYVSDCYSCLATGGTLQELFIEIPLLVLMLRLATKLNLVYSRSLVTKPQEESQEGFKLNFIT